MTTKKFISGKTYTVNGQELVCSTINYKTQRISFISPSGYRTTVKLRIGPDGSEYVQIPFYGCQGKITETIFP